MRGFGFASIWLVSLAGLVSVSTALAQVECPSSLPPPPCAGTDVTVAKRGSAALQPGVYRALRVKNGGTLVLGGGGYEFCSVKVARKGSLLFGGPASIEVAGNVMLANATSVAPEPGVSPCDVQMSVAGDSVSMQRNADVALRLCAPNAELHVANGVHFVGSIVARASHIHRADIEECPGGPSTTTTTTTVPTTTTTSQPSTTITTTTVPTTTTTSQPSTTTSTTTVPTTTTTSQPSTTITTTSISTTTTTSPTTTSSTTTSTSTSTTSTTLGAVCGNSAVEGPTETCDDGNTVDENTVDPLPPDPCPANCRIETCSAPDGTLAVDVTFASTASIAGYKIFLDYPEGKLSIPGVGQPGAGTITNDPTNSATANDLDYGLIVVAGGISAIAPQRLLTVNFTRCGGAAVVVGDIKCVVKQSSDPNGNDVPMNCSVSVPN